MAERKKINIRLPVIRLPVIRLLVDKDRNRVLFAESDKNFVEILFSFLTMPVGTIITVANKQSGLGCIDALYQSVESLGSQYFQTDNCKEMLLKPKNQSDIKCGSLDLTFDCYTGAPLYYYCPTWSCTTEDNCLISMFENTKCVCGQTMSVKRTVGNDEIEAAKLNGVFLKENKYTIYDDLEVRTISSDTNLSASLCRFGIKDWTALEERNVTVGIQEMKELLKLSMVSSTALTDVFLRTNTEIGRKKIKMERLDAVKSEPQENTKMVKLNLVISKSSDRVLYAVGKGDFLDLLFSFLTFPMGLVVELFGGHSTVGSIDKLYSSVGKIVTTTDEEILCHPRIAAHYSCKDQLLKITEQQETRVAHIHKCSTCFGEKVYGGICKHGLGTVNLRLVNPKYPNTVTTPGGGFLKESIAFMVTDELVAEPYSQISAVSYLNKQGVAFSDIEERSVVVGEKEALSLLMASLTSKAALTNVFMRKD